MFSLVLLLLAALPTQAPPQTPAPVVERVVVTATAAPTTELALGRTITFVTREDIERFAGGSIADALRLAPGIDVRARGEKGVQADFLLRGANFGQTLVLMDGARLNNAQSGHHNADFPITPAAIDRIEIVTGAASSAHGADALGGAVHIVTRQGAYRELTAAGGSFRSARGEAAAGFAPRGLSASAWGSRSAGFMFDRDFDMGGARVAAAPLAGMRVSAAHVRKAFGANGFYGPSPSKEWTNQTLLTATAGRTLASWSLEARGAYRNHSDHFRWDIARPGFAENRHETNAIEGSVRADRAFGDARLTIGGASGGDWITSTNLKNHRESRGSGFAELRVPLANRAVVQPALRIDSFSAFGTAVSPSIAASVWSSNGWRMRASAGRAFRIPTFTERYYTDPNHSARANLEPEDGWSVDSGVDFRRAAWTASGTVFRRWDGNVIDWVRATAAEKWQTTNVHEVDTYGAEIHVTRSVGAGFARVMYGWVNSRAPALTVLSKYVLDYTRHDLGAQIALPLPGAFDLSVRADRRLRSDRQKYTLVDVRIGRRMQRVTIFVEGANLLDEAYTEIAGVQMPGRSAMGGLTVR